MLKDYQQEAAEQHQRIEAGDSISQDKLLHPKCPGVLNKFMAQLERTEKQNAAAVYTQQQQQRPEQQSKRPFSAAGGRLYIHQVDPLLAVKQYQYPAEGCQPSKTISC